MEIANYKMLKLLSRKAFSSVYLATDLSHKQKVAVRLYTGTLSENPQFRRLFLTVYAKLVDIHHKHVIELLDFGIDNDTCYSVTEYLPFGDLKQQQAQIAAPCSMQYCLQIAAALSVLHRLDIVHGGVRLSNIYFDKRSDIVLGEINIAQSFMTQSNPPPMHSIATRGMPPEMKTCGQTDHRTDFYQLGLVLYALLTDADTDMPKQHPQYATEPMQTPQLPRQTRHYQPIIEQLLDAQPIQRITCAQQLLDAVNQLHCPAAQDVDTEQTTLLKHHRWIAIFMLVCLPFLTISLPRQAQHVLYTTTTTSTPGLVMSTMATKPKRVDSARHHAPLGGLSN